MANRSFYEFGLSLEPKLVSLFLSVNIGASGAVSSFKGGGVASVTKEATAGQYTIVLQDEYYRLFAVHHSVMDDAVNAVATLQILQNPATYQAAFVSSKSIIVQLLDFAGAAVNATSGAQLLLEIKLRNSTLDTYYV